MVEIYSITLFAIILTIFVLLHIFYVSETNKEKSKLINALIAKTPEHFRDLNLADKVKPIQTPDPQPSDLVPESALDEEEWDTVIQNELSNS